MAEAADHANQSLRLDRDGSAGQKFSQAAVGGVSLQVRWRGRRRRLEEGEKPVVAAPGRGETGSVSAFSARSARAWFAMRGALAVGVTFALACVGNPTPTRSAP